MSAPTTLCESMQAGIGRLQYALIILANQLEGAQKILKLYLKVVLDQGAHAFDALLERGHRFFRISFILNHRHTIEAAILQGFDKAW